MYELWLAANIVFEVLVEQAAYVLPLAIVFVVLLVAALVRRADWRASWGRAWKSAAVAGVAAFVALPSLTGAAWTDLSYVLDWLLLVALSLACAAVVGAIAWPLAALFHPRPMQASQPSTGAAG